MVVVLGYLLFKLNHLRVHLLQTLLGSIHSSVVLVEALLLEVGQVVLHRLFKLLYLFLRLHSLNVLRAGYLLVHPGSH